MRILFLSAFFMIVGIPALYAMSAATDTVTIQTENPAQKITYNVELALKTKEQRKGLMYRQELPENAGMLFVFPHTDMQQFWMKNTLIPLDLLFIDEYGIIQHIHHDAVPHDETLLSSQVPVKAVLELNGGQAYKNKISVGDKVIHKLFLAESDIIVY